MNALYKSSDDVSGRLIIYISKNGKSSALTFRYNPESFYNYIEY